MKEFGLFAAIEENIIEVDGAAPVATTAANQRVPRKPRKQRTTPPEPPVPDGWLFSPSPMDETSATPEAPNTAPSEEKRSPEQAEESAKVDLPSEPIEAEEAVNAYGEEDQDAESDVDLHGSQIEIVTGREAMQARAQKLYFILPLLVGICPMEFRIPGEPIVLDITVKERAREEYMKRDSKYQNKIKEYKEGGEVDINLERIRAYDRARKTIERAIGDLVMIYAIDPIVENGSYQSGYLLYRLPDVRRRQFAYNGIRVRKCTGGKRMLVDTQGDEVGRRSAAKSNNDAAPPNASVSQDHVSACPPAV